MAERNIWMTDEEYQLVTEKTPIPTIDLIVLRGTKNKLEVLLLTRKTGYEAGKWCVIGGRQFLGERAIDTIQRQAKDMGVNVEVIPPFEPNFPAWVHDDPEQDKTKHSITNVYPVMVTVGEVREEGDEYQGFQWFSVDQLPDNMAYHHQFEVTKAVEQLKRFTDEE